MGVHRLWSYIKRNRDVLMTYVDLVEIAEGQPERLKILVDFYSWEHFIVIKFWQSLTQSAQNRNIIFAGGEYGLIDTFIKEFVERLRAVNIELVFFLDGAKGSAYASSKQKLRTWQSRYFEDQRRLRDTADFLRGKLPFEQIDREHLTRPCLQEVQNLLTLQECGCIIHVQVSGEADHILAKHLRDDPAAFAVFSNDTDFCVFENCVLMPFDFFDMNNDLGLGLKSLSIREPEHLKCGIIHTESVRNLLGLPNNESLIELAIISGNDFTLPFLSTIQAFKTSYMGQLNKLADMIYRNGVAEQCDFFGPVIASNPELQEAVEHSRQFYSLKLKEEEDQAACFNFNFIADGIRKGKLPSTIVAMYRGLYWHRQVLEDPSPGFPCADLALNSLRAYMYTILLPSDRTCVTEIGRTPYQPVQKIIVMKAPDRRIPDIGIVRHSSFARNLRLFELIMQHQEPLAMDLGMATYKITPSGVEDSSTQLLYRNAYAFLGNILNLSHKFPAPRDLFSGAAWVALFTACAVNDPNPQFREPLPQSVSMEDMWKIRNTVNQIVTANKDTVSNIIKGVFPFD